MWAESERRSTPSRSTFEVEEAGSLHGVGMDQDATFPGEARDVRDRLNGPDLVVGEHHAHEERVGPDRRRDRGRIDDPALVDRDVGHLDAEVLLKVTRRTQHRAVLDRRRDEVPSTRAGQRNTLKSHVVALGAAAGEHDLVVAAGEDPGDLGACPLARLGGAPAERGEARGIAELLLKVRLHGLAHPRMNGGSRCVVEIDRSTWCCHHRALSRLRPRDSSRGPSPNASARRTKSGRRRSRRAPAPSRA